MSVYVYVRFGITDQHLRTQHIANTYYRRPSVYTFIEPFNTNNINTFQLTTYCLILNTLEFVL